MIKSIEIREYLEERMNGDRASRLSESSRFDVVLVTHRGEAVLHVFDRYDGFHTHVAKRDQVWPEARAYARRIADTLKIEVSFRVFAEKKVEQIEWVEVADRAETVL